MYASCAYPNCSTPVTRCDIHHVRWWSAGGPTDRLNLIPLCKQHHMFVHEHGYTIQPGLDPGGGAVGCRSGWTFVTPRGQPISDHRKTCRRFVEQLMLIHPSEP